MEELYDFNAWVREAGIDPDSIPEDELMSWFESFEQSEEYHEAMLREIEEESQE